MRRRFDQRNSLSLARCFILCSHFRGGFVAIYDIWGCIGWVAQKKASNKVDALVIEFILPSADFNFECTSGRLLKDS